MATGRKELRKIQFGKETTPGTAVAATTIWRGTATMLDDQRVIEEIEEHVGIWGGTDRDRITKYMGGIQFEETPATFEQFQYLLAAALGGPVTGAADGVGTDLIYTTTLPTTSGVTPKTYTIEAGDDHEAEEMAYSVVTEITLKGKVGETARMGCTWIGQTVTTSTFTGALSLPSVEEAVVLAGKVYLDDVDGTPGTTQVSTAIISFDLKISARWRPAFTMDGSLSYSRVDFTGFDVEGSLVYLHDTAAGGATGAKTFFRNRTPKILYLDLIGGAVETGGTAYQEKHIIVELPIKYGNPKIADDDGDDTVEFTFKSRYNDTYGSRGQIIVVNELSALP